MLEKYYVNRNTDGQVIHEVHRESCDYLPQLANREFLGYHNNSHDAVAKAKQKYPTADGCWFCCPESHTR